MKNILLMMTSLLLTGCLSMPETVKPVDDFDINLYLGKWYEIARLDHVFERGLNNEVSAEYRLKDNGGILVVNRGYSDKTKEWKVAEGKAYFVDKTNQGYLKVSFFGPFYGAYVIFELDHENYQYAFVSGPNTDYLWLLARTPTVSQDVIEHFITLSKAHGFDTEQLIYINHSK